MSSLNSLELGLNRASVIQFKTEVLQSLCSARSQVNNESTERGKYSTSSSTLISLDRNIQDGSQTSNQWADAGDASDPNRLTPKVLTVKSEMEFVRGPLLLRGPISAVGVAGSAPAASRVGAIQQPQRQQQNDADAPLPFVVPIAKTDSRGTVGAQNLLATRLPQPPSPILTSDCGSSRSVARTEGISTTSSAGTILPGTPSTSTASRGGCSAAIDLTSAEDIDSLTRGTCTNHSSASAALPTFIQPVPIRYPDPPTLSGQESHWTKNAASIAKGNQAGGLVVETMADRNELRGNSCTHISTADMSSSPNAFSDGHNPIKQILGSLGHHASKATCFNSDTHTATFQLQNKEKTSAMTDLFSDHSAFNPAAASDLVGEAMAKPRASSILSAFSNCAAIDQEQWTGEGPDFSTKLTDLSEKFASCESKLEPVVAVGGGVSWSFREELSEHELSNHRNTCNLSISDRQLHFFRSRIGGHMKYGSGALEVQLPETSKPCAETAEPVRSVSHRDCLLMEVQWMAVDFRQEARWKIAASDCVSQDCNKSVCYARKPLKSLGSCSNVQSATSSVLSSSLSDAVESQAIIAAETGPISHVDERSVQFVTSNERGDSALLSMPPTTLHRRSQLVMKSVALQASALVRAFWNGVSDELQNFSPKLLLPPLQVEENKCSGEVTAHQTHMAASVGAMGSADTSSLTLIDTAAAADGNPLPYSAPMNDPGLSTPIGSSTCSSGITTDLFMIILRRLATKLPACVNASSLHVPSALLQPLGLHAGQVDSLRRMSAINSLGYGAYLRDSPMPTAGAGVSGKTVIACSLALLWLNHLSPGRPKTPASIPESSPDKTAAEKGSSLLKKDIDSMHSLSTTGMAQAAVLIFSPTERVDQWKQQMISLASRQKNSDSSPLSVCVWHPGLICGRRDRRENKSGEISMATISNNTTSTSTNTNTNTTHTAMVSCDLDRQPSHPEPEAMNRPHNTNRVIIIPLVYCVRFLREFNANKALGVSNPIELKIVGLMVDCRSMGYINETVATSNRLAHQLSTSLRLLSQFMPNQQTNRLKHSEMPLDQCCHRCLIGCAALPLPKLLFSLLSFLTPCFFPSFPEESDAVEGDSLGSRTESRSTEQSQSSYEQRNIASQVLNDLTIFHQPPTYLRPWIAKQMQMEEMYAVVMDEVQLKKYSRLEKAFVGDSASKAVDTLDVDCLGRLGTALSCLRVASFHSSLLDLHSPSPSPNCGAVNNGGRGGSNATTRIGALNVRPSRAGFRSLVQCDLLSSVGRLVTGSCKLRALQELLLDRRFIGKRVVVIVATSEEELIAHKFLYAQGVPHISALSQTSLQRLCSARTPSIAAAYNFDILSRLQDESASIRWSIAVSEFNDQQPRTSPTEDYTKIAQVILTSSLRITRSSYLPLCADAVIVLSDFWCGGSVPSSSWEHKFLSALCLKRCESPLSATECSPCVRIVRVVAKNTLEEAIARESHKVLEHYINSPNLILATPLEHADAVECSPALEFSAFDYSILGPVATTESKDTYASHTCNTTHQLASCGVFGGAQRSCNTGLGDGNTNPRAGKGAVCVHGDGTTWFLRNRKESKTGRGDFAAAKGILPQPNERSQRTISSTLSDRQALRTYNDTFCYEQTPISDHSGNFFGSLLPPPCFLERYHIICGNMNRSDNYFSATLRSAYPPLGASLPAFCPRDQQKESRHLANRRTGMHSITCMAPDVNDGPLPPDFYSCISDCAVNYLHTVRENRLDSDTVQLGHCYLDKSVAVLSTMLVILEADELRKVSDMRKFALSDGVRAISRSLLLPCPLSATLEHAQSPSTHLLWTADATLGNEHPNIGDAIPSCSVETYSGGFAAFGECLSNLRRSGVAADGNLFAHPLQTLAQSLPDSYSRSLQGLKANMPSLGVRLISPFLLSGPVTFSSSRHPKRKRNAMSTFDEGIAAIGTNPILSPLQLTSFKYSTSTAPRRSKQSPPRRKKCFHTMSSKSITDDAPISATHFNYSALSNSLQWHPTEDDIIVCMQTAVSDPEFVHTQSWLNKTRQAQQPHHSNPSQPLRRKRTAEDARVRYADLCASGWRELRLRDSTIQATISKLRGNLSTSFSVANS